MKVLVIEDNPVNMKLLIEILSTEGYETLQAKNAGDGIELAKRENPDLILMDIQLPGMNGLDAMRLLKGNRGTAHIRIIALTAFAMKGDREKFLQEGFDGYISKPFRYTDLMDLVRSLSRDRESTMGG
ncbi:MAG: response regulator [Nitrospirae bacterium]|nr:response regulator [Nitrospirota bacterium]